ncbi:hypothetical protein ACMGEE_02455 [Erwinia sp. DT-104]|uniref:Uncharacterized protein n=1 Tax=Erwinia aeris TaxID=3239803 RepID=A0ABV4E381_9GAMM
MSYNAAIIKKLEAENYLALVLEKGVKEVGREALKQGELIYNGVERLSWYSSCLRENYQDVCEKIRKEDVRFIRSILKIIPTFHFKLPHIGFEFGEKKNNYSDVQVKDNVIKYMLKIFTEDVFSEIHYERRLNLNRILTKLSADYATVNFTNRSIAYSIASAIYMSAGLRATLESTLTSISRKSTTVLGGYGYVKIAIDAADRLKLINPILYTKFYNTEVEMLYFLIEPVVTKIDHKFRHALTDEQIASDIVRLIK